MWQDLALHGLTGVLSPHSSLGFEPKISHYSLPVLGLLCYGYYLIQPHIYKMDKGTKIISAEKPRIKDRISSVSIGK